MKELNIKLNLYSIDELEGKAKRKAIEEHRQFLLSVMVPDDFISGDPNYDTKENLQQQYESEYECYLMNDEPIIEDIQINDYLFFLDGTLANIHTNTLINDNVLKFLGNEYHF